MTNKLKWREAFLLRHSLKRKLKEFHRAGYLNVVETEMWDYLIEKKWKSSSDKTITEYKNDIKNIVINDFFDYQQLKAQVKNVDSFDFGDIQDLL
ncbi:post-transcriptional regulator [Vagococcus elongatus]|uniref:Post-transcriptional regulator n=1 Tax=Vagococcus elongatus TaxID=180344 RepID=A0A430B145_9ENTE|nr:post-transcriptional regulator [Vagococcus elongatus]RSU14045.1 hypothetical protein CBF29_03950 [Vagococcus elongatus]